MHPSKASPLRFVKNVKKKENKEHPTPRRRLFTNEFKLGDRVGVVRTEHGWYDGGLEGRITVLTAGSAEVTDDDGMTYEINHPRDIFKLS